MQSKSSTKIYITQ